MRASVGGFALGILLVLAVTLLPAAQVARAQPSDVTLNWGEDRDMKTLDPRVTQSRHEWQVIMHVFDSLIFHGNDGKLYPWLAESWRYAPDGLSVTFKLRRNVRFHDGTPFNAQAVKFNFDSIVDPKLGSQAAIDHLGPYKSTTVIDPYTVRVSWTRPFGPALLNFSQSTMGIVSPAAVKKLGDDAFSRNPVGTGMFRFVEWVPRVRIVLERNEHYRWAPAFFKRQGPPQVKRVVIRIIEDDSTRVAALEKGEVHIAESVPPLDVRRLKDSQNFDVMIGQVSGYPESLVFNLKRPPMDDSRVRRAFMHAINRPRLVEQVFFGLKKPVYSIVTPTMPGYWPGAEKLYPYDLARARQLLEEAGWKPGSDGIRVKDGQRLELFFRTLVFPDVAVAVQAAVKDAGIQLRVENVTKAKQDELILNNDYHILTLSWSGIDPSLLNTIYSSRNIPRAGKFGFNWNQISSAQLDRLLAQADAATDPGRRAVLLQQIQKFVLENALAFPIHPLVQATGYRKSVRNLVFASSWYQVWWYNATVSQ